jgi:FimV-like protein
MQYFLIIALQVYCFYHIYKTGRPFYWYFIVLLLPLIGSIVFIITQVFSKKDAEKIQSNVSSIINPTKRIKNLEKRLEFSESYQNRMDLADACFEIEDYENAILHYNIMLENKVQDDYYARQQLIISCSKIKDHTSVINHGNKIKHKPDFKASRTEFYYGFALYQLGEKEDAGNHLKTIDRPYSNYEERLELAKFYLDNNNEDKAKALLEDIVSEADYMTKPNRKLFKSTIAEVNRLLETI